MIALLFLGILAAWLCWRLVFARYWRADLKVKTEFTDPWVYEGETSCLREEITNDKILPVPALEVRLAMSRNLEFSSDARDNTSVTDQSYKRDIFSLLTRQRIVRRLPFVCRRRGSYEIRQAGSVATELLSDLSGRGGPEHLHVRLSRPGGYPQDRSCLPRGQRNGADSEPDVPGSV